jgi:hypothetical protein
MKRSGTRRFVASLFACLIFLGGCYRPEPEPYVDPYPYSFTDSTKPTYPRSLFGAQRFVEDAWDLWIYRQNVGVKYPEEAYRTMRGDCDDFAVMVAGYLQAYFGYDSFIACPTVDGVGHACAFVIASSGVVYVSDCFLVPTITLGATGALYYPVDMARCPGWTWANPGSSVGPLFEWSDLAGNSYLSAD